MPETKKYLGDSVYVDIEDGGYIRITTENGLLTDPSNLIYLNFEVAKNLRDFINEYLKLRE